MSTPDTTNPIAPPAGPPPKLKSAPKLTPEPIEETAEYVIDDGKSDIMIRIVPEIERANPGAAPVVRAVEYILVRKSQNRALSSHRAERFCGDDPADLAKGVNKEKLAAYRKRLEDIAKRNPEDAGVQLSEARKAADGAVIRVIAQEERKAKLEAAENEYYERAMAVVTSAKYNTKKK